MIDLVRRLPVLLLALSLGFGAPGMLPLGGERVGAGLLVEICAADGVRLVRLDGNGRQLPAEGHCPDCLPVLAKALLPQGADAPLPLRLSRRAGPAAPDLAIVPPALGPLRARGPPRAV